MPGINVVLRVRIVGALAICAFVSKAAQKCWCFSLFKFCFEISLSQGVSLNSTLIIFLSLK